MSPDQILKKLREDSQKCVDFALNEFATLHTGKASPSMVEGVNVYVESYGTTMKVRDMAAVSTPDSRTITVTPWDPGTLKALEKGIREANLGFNPSIDGQLIRINVPELSKERRQELSKIAGKMSEDARVSARQVRREAMEALKTAEKNKEISEDELSRFEKDVQKVTDESIAKINEALDHKEAELMKVG